ncbi:MAG: YdcF family protein [Candidatus Obscuribacterales bacterium]|nr:YdcF family protein [Candidatus Obscuribacterales bacterium]
MAEFVRATGIKPNRLLIEDQSFNTFGNAIYSVDRYLKHRKSGTLYVVTSPFHIERALFIFRQVLGPSWTVIDCPAEKWSEEKRQSGAPQAIERARLFFVGIKPGDLRAAKKSC